MTHRHAQLFIVVALLGALAFVPDLRVASAAGVTITVTTTEDELTNNGQCSLREAILAANTDSAVDGCPAGSGADTVSLASGSYTLGIPGIDEDAGLSGDLDITAPLTITGVTSDTTVINAGQLDRVLHAFHPLTLSDLTVRNGKVVTTDYRTASGIFQEGDGLTLTRTTVSDNVLEFKCTNPDGCEGTWLGAILARSLVVIASTITNNNSYAGIFASNETRIINSLIAANNRAGISTPSDNCTTYFTITIEGSTIRDNGDAWGYGICGSAFVTGSTFVNNSIIGSFTINESAFHNSSIVGFAPTITNSIFKGSTISSQGHLMVRDSTISDGMGIVNNNGPGVLENVVITQNTQGIYNTGTLTISNSIIRDNGSVNEDGGGIFTTRQGTLTVINSAITNNTARRGGGIFVMSSDPTDYLDTKLIIRGSTIHGNYASDIGGGIANVLGDVTIANSTISGNHAANDGGGIYNRTGRLRSNNTTIVYNTADSDGNGIGDGGGVFYVRFSDDIFPFNSNRNELALIYVRNTILARNSDTGGQAPECAGRLQSQGYNLIESRDRCAIRGFTKGNRYGQDPLLGPLQDNGGPTWTHALLPSSPAIDAGNWLFPSRPAIDAVNRPRPGNGGYECERYDQRGVRRPQEGNGKQPRRCDIGAFELIP